MKITTEDVSRLRSLIIRFVNKYKRLDTKAMDFGTGDLLYPSEIHVIEAIGNNVGKTVNEICQKFCVTKGGVSQVVKKLLKKGLVIKERNPDYYKEMILSLTKIGKKAFKGHEKFHKLMDEELYMFLSDFYKKDLKILESLLLKIDEYMEKIMNKIGEI